MFNKDFNFQETRTIEFTYYQTETVGTLTVTETSVVIKYGDKEDHYIADEEGFASALKSLYSKNRQVKEFNLNDSGYQPMPIEPVKKIQIVLPDEMSEAIGKIKVETGLNVSALGRELFAQYLEDEHGIKVNPRMVWGKS